MTSFEDIIRSRIPQVENKLENERAEQARQHELRVRLQDEQNTYGERSITVARRAAQLLLENHIPTTSIWARPEGRGPIVEVGQGWHVVTMLAYQGSDMPPYQEHFGLNKDTHTLLRFSRKQYIGEKEEKGQSWDGIIFPTSLSPSAGMVDLLESDSFNNGLASLLAGHGPYLEPSISDFR